MHHRSVLRDGPRGAPLACGGDSSPSAVSTRETKALRVFVLRRPSRVGVARRSFGPARVLARAPCEKRLHLSSLRRTGDQECLRGDEEGSVFGHPLARDHATRRRRVSSKGEARAQARVRRCGSQSGIRVTVLPDDERGRIGQPILPLLARIERSWTCPRIVSVLQKSEGVVGPRKPCRTSVRQGERGPSSRRETTGSKRTRESRSAARNVSGR